MQQRFRLPSAIGSDPLDIEVVLRTRNIGDVFPIGMPGGRELPSAVNVRRVKVPRLLSDTYKSEAFVEPIETANLDPSPERLGVPYTPGLVSSWSPSPIVPETPLGM